MASKYCVVGGCKSNSNTHKLFNIPANDNIRSLWLSMLVPTNSSLHGLSKSQIISRKVCEKHFEKSQFCGTSKRLTKYSYPSLFTEKERLLGAPHSTEDYTVLKEHNYCSTQHKAMKEHDYCSQILNEDALMGDTTPMDIPTTLPTDEASKVADVKPIDVSQPASTSTEKAKRFTTKTRRYIKECVAIAESSLGKNSGERLKSAQSLGENLTLMNNFEKLNKQAQTFLLMQLRLVRKNKMARKFSLEEKLFSLSIMKNSPKCYKLLESKKKINLKRKLINNTHSK